MKTKSNRILIGTAGWSLSRQAKPFFPEEGSHLQRYAERLNAVEINSSFYKPHAEKVFRKWAEATPDHFRFSVKLSKEVTHEKRFKVTQAELNEVVEPYFGLGKKLGVILIQLPPSFAFVKKDAEAFFKKMRKLTDLPLAVEPRHLTWVLTESRELFEKYDLTKVEADPERCETTSKEWEKCGFIRYHRLHGSPVIYRSRYSDEDLNELAARIKSEKRPSWVIFDNTANDHAIPNALSLSAI